MAIGALALTACKKEEVTSTELGEATIKGNVYADLDYTNDMNSAGYYEAGLVNESVEGMVVSVEVNTYYWDQTPDDYYEYDVVTYTATTDANGDYTLTIPATLKPYTVTLEFSDVYTTRTYYSVDGNAVTEDVEVSMSNKSVEIYKDASISYQDEANISATTSGQGDDFGTATIRGTVYCDWDFDNAGYDGISGSPLDGKTLKFALTSGYTINGVGAENVYTATIQSDGTYELTVPTYVDLNYGVYYDAYIDSFFGDVVSGGSSVAGYYEYNNTYVTYVYNEEINVVDVYVSASQL